MRTISKPSGLPIFSETPTGDSVVTRLFAEDPWRRAIAWPQGFGAGLVHRVDVTTSGALLVADTLDELRYLRAWLAEGRFARTYVFRAGGPAGWVAPEWTSSQCDLPVAYSREGAVRAVLRTRSGLPHRGEWVAATTRFQRLGDDRYAAFASTLAQHQIRVHAAQLGIPLLGDVLYGGAAPATGTAANRSFFLHHVGMVGPAGIHTEPVPAPAWVGDLRGLQPVG